MTRLARQEGQAALELVAAVPMVLAVAFAVAQVLAVGYAAVLAGNAAEAGALALAARVDAKASARDALPGWGRTRARVSTRAGRVTVRLRPPALLDVLARRLEVSSSAAVAR